MTNVPETLKDELKQVHRSGKLIMSKWKVDNVDEFHHLLLIILIVLIILSRYIKWRVGTVWLVGSRRWLKVSTDAKSNG